MKSSLYVVILLIFAAFCRADEANWFEEQWGKVKEVFKDAFKDASDFIKNIDGNWADLNETARNKLTSLKAKLKEAGEVMENAADSVSEQAKKSYKDAKEAMNKVFAKEFWTQQWEKANKKYGEVSADVKKMYDDMKPDTDAINLKIASFSDKVVLKYQELGNEFKRVIDGADMGNSDTVKAMKAKFDQFKQTVAEAEMWKDFKATTATWSEKTKAKWGEMKEDFSDVLQDALVKKDEWSADMKTAYAKVETEFAKAKDSTADAAEASAVSMGDSMKSFQASYYKAFPSAELSDKDGAERLTVTLILLIAVML